MPPAFDKREYWEQRFSSETSFEWLMTSESFVTVLEPYLANLAPDTPILHLGFGTSDLQVHLRKRGFTSITNIDFEPLAVERGQDLERAAFGNVQMTYLVADCTQLHLDRRYDLILDKSTVDAVACGVDAAFPAMMDSVARHLTEDGIWISISYSAYRYDSPSLPLAVEVIAQIPVKKQKPTDPDVFTYCYLLRRRPDAHAAKDHDEHVRAPHASSN